MNKYGIYAMGAALVDTEIQVDDADLQKLNVDKGVMTLVDENRQAELLDALSDKIVASSLACGGSAANSIIAAQYFGSQTYFSCQVASDDHGNFYAEDLMRAGVATQAQADARPGTTGKCLVMITPDAERTMNTHLGISESLSIENINEEALNASHTVYIEGYLVTSATGKPAAIKLRELAQKAGKNVAISLSDPAIVSFFRDGLKEIIGEQVDMIFCNQAEALNFTECDTLEAAADALKAYSRRFAITRGSEPSLLFDGDNYCLIDTLPVKAIDTNGAGDMFAGAFLAAVDQGRALTDAAAFANRAAAAVVSQFGPRLTAEQYEHLRSEMGPALDD